MAELSKNLIVAGVILIGAGILLLILSKFFGAWKLPGDIAIRRGKSAFYFPIMTCVVASVLLTLFLNLFQRK